MELPIRFPTPAEVVAREAAEFRSLTPAGRVRALADCVNLYYLLADRAFRPDAVARYAAEEEARGRTAIQEFARRHG